MTQPLTKHRGYSAGHPWYYYLGGDVPTLKQIQAEAIASDYNGYLAYDIAELDLKCEPQRSSALRDMKARFSADLKQDVSTYRAVVRELRRNREQEPVQEPFKCCNDIHTSMSLKFSHLYNDFAHLNFLDELLADQPDLIGPV